MLSVRSDSLKQGAPFLRFPFEFELRMQEREYITVSSYILSFVLDLFVHRAYAPVRTPNDNSKLFSTNHNNCNLNTTANHTIKDQTTACAVTGRSVMRG